MTQDVIIIGTGVIGSALAFELSKAGYKTLSLDRTRAVGHGSTAGSCAIIRMHYSTWDGTALAWEGYHDWRDWEEYLGLPADAELAKFREVGCLVMRTEANGYLEKHMKFSSELNCPFEVWEPEEITQKLPIFDLASFAPARRLEDADFGQSNGAALRGAVFWPHAGYVTDPALSAQNLMAAAQAKGAKVELGVEVTEILQSGGRVTGVALADGTTREAAIVVNVAGPGSAAINAMAGVLDEMTIETRPLRQEVAHVPAPPGFNFEEDGMIVSDSDIACYVRPEQGNHILVGSEDPPCDPHTWTESDTEYNRDFTDQWTVQARRFGQRVPTLGIPSATRGVVDLYDASTDWIPIYDATSLGGYYMACGTSGNQYKNAPVAAKMMRELIDYVEAGNDHDASPLSFKLPYTRHDLNVGFFSRKRPINEDSSFSVLG